MTCYNIISATPLYKEGKLIGGLSLDRDISELIETAESLKKNYSNLQLFEQEITKMNKIKNSFSQILGDNKTFRDMINLAKGISKSNVSVVILGESGTGKELFARAIHTESEREGYFVPINCSAIPSELIESEFFGYEAGAFTGALKTGKMGKIEFAHKGTIFLDEVGDMPLNLQAKLLRALEDRVITRVGSQNSIKVDVRVISASNKDLADMVKKGSFRKDLYYRLNTVQIKIPPLRERKDDIPILVNKFAEDFCTQYHTNMINIPSDIMNILINYRWEGNVRELKNVIERAVVLAKNQHSNVIKLEYLPEDIINNIYDKKISVKNDCQYDLNKAIANTEKELIIKVMNLTNNNKTKAAKLLNIPRSTLHFKIKKYNLNF